ncbi:Calx-beta domain-containing protein, partial [Spongiimicrobium sp. 3-5]|uniref:Calx-beta domain-containing protein n=1 Tax=Spongiimicrobium sp. 3-5 TaxID=3332596 RepID=UPI00397F67C0
MRNKTTYSIKKPILFMLLLISMASFGQVKEAFTPRYSETVNGDITIIANNVLSRHATNAYTGAHGNHDFYNNVFVDIDFDSSTFNSSSANFTNPEPGVSCLNFKKVYLYWAAADKEYDDDTGTGEPEPNWNYNQVKLMLPGQSSYNTVSADEVIYRGRSEHFINDPYVCVKDITTEVEALANPYGKFQIANVKATEGDLYSHGGAHTGTSGGWQIVFIYESTELIGKNVTIFDGYVHISEDDGEVEFDFSGFQTVPNGNVNADIVLGSLEGDRDISGDQLQIFDTNSTWSNLSTGIRNENNFFNSRITKNNLDFVDRNPASTNTLGFDAAVFDLNNTGNKFIGNNQTSARLKITSDQETYGVYLLGLSVEVYEPSLGALNFTSSSSGGGFNPGDNVQMTLSIENSGNDDIQDLEIFTTLPVEVDFVDTETLPSGVTHSFNTTTRELRFFVPNGNTDVGDPLYTLDFNVQVKDQCYFLETACSANFAMQATASFRGVTNTNPVTTNSSGTTDDCGIGNHDATVVDINEPNQVNWTTTPNELDSTISCDDTTALNAALALEPQTEFCNFTLNKVAGSFVPNPGCDSEGTYTNTFTFTDACGRVSDTFTQVITIEDTTAPTFNEALPQNTVAAYDNIPSAETLTASDNCDTNASVNLNESYIGDNTSTTYIIVRTWTASDCAGNQTPHEQRIYVTENGDPIGLVINDINSDEDAGTAIFEVTLTGETTANFTLDYIGANVTAIAPNDYTLAGGSLGFNGTHGETQNITVTINDDTVIEDTEEYTVELSNLSTNEIPINDGSGLGTILDNDAASISINDLSIDEDAGTINLQVTLSGAVEESFTVDFATADGTALAGSDYVSDSGQVTFPPNSTDGSTQNIALTITDDNFIEPTEDFVVNLSNINATGAITIADSQGTVTITDNDGGAGNGISFDSNDVTVDEGAGTATFRVRLTGNVQGG